MLYQKLNKGILVILLCSLAWACGNVPDEVEDDQQDMDEHEVATSIEEEPPATTNNSPVLEKNGGIEMDSPQLDSLLTRIQTLEVALEKAKSQANNAGAPIGSTRVVVPSSLRKLVDEFLSGWEVFGDNQDLRPLLKCFSDEYNVSMVLIDSESQGEIIQGNPRVFEKQLKTRMKKEGYSLEISSPEYLYVEQLGPFYSISFKTLFSHYQNGSLLHKTDNLLTISGRTRQSPLIGDLHWIEIAKGN